MKLKSIVGVCLLVICCGMWCNIRAEHVHYGDFTLPGDCYFDGDLTIIAGNLDLKDTFTIAGDLKIISGNVRVSSNTLLTSTVDLHVCGDMLVTNTEECDDVDATITVSTGKLIVTGELFTWSPNGKASIQADYGVKAAKIEAEGLQQANLEALKGSIDVVGDIFTTSSGDAHIKAGGDVKAAAIFTWGDGYMQFPSTCNGEDPPPAPDEDPQDSAFIEAGGSIRVDGMIVTRSKRGSAHVDAGRDMMGNIRADSIFTDGWTRAFVHVAGGLGGSIDVLNDIVTKSYTSTADVLVTDGFLRVGNVSTDGIWSADIKASDYIIAKGDMRTTSTRLSGVVKVTGDFGTLKAKSITTSAKTDAHVLAPDSIDVAEAIVTYCFGDGERPLEFDGDSPEDRVVGKEEPSPGPRPLFFRSRQGFSPTFGAFVTTYGGVGDIKAGSIKTNASIGDGDVYAEDGSILVDGTINTRSWEKSATVYALNGDVHAESIYTDGGTFSGVNSYGSTDIIVKDVINTKSHGWDPVYSIAPVYAIGDIVARSIKTYAYADASIESNIGSIKVVEDISTESYSAQSYVWAENGDVLAQRIKMEGPDDDGGSVRAKAATGKFMLVFDYGNGPKSFTNCHFDFDRDFFLEAEVTFYGDCVLNGKGHQLNLVDSGALIVAEDATLTLNNITLNDLEGMNIRCIAPTTGEAGIIKFNNVVWNQTDDFTFDNGKIEVIGYLDMNGPGFIFSYETDQISTIREDAMWSLRHSLTFWYNTDNMNRIAMDDETARFHFDDAILFAPQDARFTTGTLVFDNKVDFVIPPGQTIYLGNNAAEGNLHYEYHVASQWNKVGAVGSIVNQNV